VELQVKLGGTGLLKLFCHGVDEEFVTALSFDLSLAEQPGQKSQGDNMSQNSKVPQKSKTAIEKYFAKVLKPSSDKQQLNGVFKELEVLLGTGRKNWSLETLRFLFDMVIDDNRFKDSSDTLCVLFRLAGFCLRPGYGFSGDEERVRQAFQLFGLLPDNSNSELACEKWIMLKRIGPGFGSEIPEQLCVSSMALLFPPKRPPPGFIKPSQHERNQIWRMIGHFERISVDQKIRIGNIIVRSPGQFC
jgi:hypothetical protein